MKKERKKETSAAAAAAKLVDGWIDRKDEKK